MSPWDTTKDLKFYVHISVTVYMYVSIRLFSQMRTSDVRSCCISNTRYGVAMTSRLLSIIGLFCKRPYRIRQYSAKETYNFEEPTNRSHPIVALRHRYTLLFFIFIGIHVRLIETTEDLILQYKFERWNTCERCTIHLYNNKFERYHKRIQIWEIRQMWEKRQYVFSTTNLGDKTYTAPEASWRRVFDPYNTL